MFKSIDTLFFWILVVVITSEEKLQVVKFFDLSGNYVDMSYVMMAFRGTYIL